MLNIGWIPAAACCCCACRVVERRLPRPSDTSSSSQLQEAGASHVSVLRSGSDAGSVCDAWKRSDCFSCRSRVSPTSASCPVIHSFWIIDAPAGAGEGFSGCCFTLHSTIGSPAGPSPPPLVLLAIAHCFLRFKWAADHDQTPLSWSCLIFFHYFRMSGILMKRPVQRRVNMEARGSWSGGGGALWCFSPPHLKYFGSSD